MNINKKILKIGTCGLLVLFVLCIGFTLISRLEHPVFLRYCIDVEAPSNTMPVNGQVVLELQYFSNVQDKRTVNGISFEEAPGINFYASEDPQTASYVFFSNTDNQKSFGENYGRYQLHKVYVSMYNYFKEEWEGTIYLKNAEVSFNNGDKLTADIGRIMLYSDSDKAYNNTFRQDMARSSSDGSSSSTYRLLDEITVHKLQSDCLEDADEVFDISFNDADYQDIPGKTYAKGSRVLFSVNYQDPGDGNRKYDIYDIRPELDFEYADGTADYLRFYNIRNQRYFSGLWDVLRYLRSRGAV